MKRSWFSFFAAVAIAVVGGTSAQAAVELPAIFTSHMVLQRDQANPVWGKAAPGEEVTVSLGDKSYTAKAGDDGRWTVKLDPLAVGGPHKITVKGASNEVVLDDVLVGEVWICSGQSNMQWSVDQSTNPDLEKLTAKYPQIRFISVPQVGTQEPQFTFKGEWTVCTPETVGQLSGVGYFFGRQLHNTLNVPIGLIDDAWGGSGLRGLDQSRHARQRRPLQRIAREVGEY
ncbi:MAG: hypothetical protein QM775_12450 [Pirellulales bacterium]